MEAQTLRLESGPHSLQLEKAREQQRRPITAINKLINSLKKKKTYPLPDPGSRKICTFTITGQENGREKFTGRQGNESECPCGSGDLRQGSGWGESRGTMTACSSNGPSVVLMGIQD